MDDGVGQCRLGDHDNNNHDDDDGLSAANLVESKPARCHNTE